MSKETGSAGATMMNGIHLGPGTQLEVAVLDREQATMIQRLEPQSCYYYCCCCCYHYSFQKEKETRTGKSLPA